MWKDKISYYISESGFKMVIAYTTNIVSKARALHDLSPVATAALGRTMTGALLLANDFKNHEGVSIKIDGDGPLGKIYADAYDTDKVRGYVMNPQVDLPLNEEGKLNVGAAVGAGTLYVTRYSLLRQPYQSAIKLVSGEIAEDLTYYLTISEQIPSAVSLGVSVNKNVVVEAAGGILIQALPDADESALAQAENNVYRLGAITTAMKNMSEPEILATLSQGLNFKLLQERPLFWSCTCSKERFEDALLRLSPEDKNILLNDPYVEMVCHYCNKKYTVTNERLRKLYEGADMNG